MLLWLYATSMSNDSDMDAQRPNIILIMCDDLAGAVRLMGIPTSRPPSRQGANAARFTRFAGGPVCHQRAAPV